MNNGQQIKQAGFTDGFKVEYFTLEDGQFEKKIMEKNTNLFSQGLNEFESASEIQNYGIMEPEEDNFQMDRRSTRNVISIGQARRNSYIRAKRGHGDQTSDLSRNMSTLVKALCLEYETFERVQNGSQQRIEQFYGSTFSLKSLNKLLEPEQGNSTHELISAEWGSKGPRTASLSQFLSQKLEQPSVVGRILKNKKMKFSNKIVSLKYLGRAKDIAQNPSQFQKWKRTDSK